VSGIWLVSGRYCVVKFHGVFGEKGLVHGVFAF